MTPRKTVTFRYKSESDKGPYPIPGRVKREGGSDRHVLIVDKDAAASRTRALVAARQGRQRPVVGRLGRDLESLRLNRLRPEGWTSADAAGLPIMPGLVRYDEVAAGVSPMPSVSRGLDHRTAHHLPGPPRRRR